MCWMCIISCVISLCMVVVVLCFHEREVHRLLLMIGTGLPDEAAPRKAAESVQAKAIRRWRERGDGK